MFANLSQGVLSFSCYIFLHGFESDSGFSPQSLHVLAVPVWGFSPGAPASCRSPMTCKLLELATLNVIARASLFARSVKDLRLAQGASCPRSVVVVLGSTPPCAQDAQ